jgi:hypothetical protein
MNAIPLRQALNLPPLTMPPRPFEMSTSAQTDRRASMQEVIADVLRLMDQVTEQEEQAEDGQNSTLQEHGQ